MAAQVQDRGDPLQRLAAGSQDRDPASGYCLVYATAVRQRGVEPAGERDRGRVGDRVLHRGHGSDPAAGQRRCRPGEQVADASSSAGAGVQHNQAGHRPGLAQQVSEPAGVHQVRPPVLAGQRQHALIAVRVKVTMPDKVQHVPRPGQQHLVQPRPGRRRPGYLGQAQLHRARKRALQLLTLPGSIQRRQAAWGRDHAQDLQRRVHLERRRDGGDRHMADQLMVTAYVPPSPRIVHGLPGSPASSGASIRSTIRSSSSRSAATAALARYRPATSPAPSSAANRVCPASRTSAQPGSGFAVRTPLRPAASAGSAAVLPTVRLPRGPYPQPLRLPGSALPRPGVSPALDRSRSPPRRRSRQPRPCILARCMISDP